jgi:uncharacterized protein
MEKEHKDLLLKLARKTIEKKSSQDVMTFQEIDRLPGELKERRGCFVTLTKKNELRGCIGYILPISPVYQAVTENAYNAAYSDPRFIPVERSEIKDLHIEISILSLPEKINYGDEEELLKKITPHKDGLVVRKGHHSATFLPQVWEQLPDKKDFLNHLCLKAGLKPNEWSTAALEVEIYHVEAFEEEKKG